MKCSMMNREEAGVPDTQYVLCVRLKSNMCVSVGPGQELELHEGASPRTDPIPYSTG